MRQIAWITKKNFSTHAIPKNFWSTIWTKLTTFLKHFTKRWGQSFRKKKQLTSSTRLLFDLISKHSIHTTRLSAAQTIRSGKLWRFKVQKAKYFNRLRHHQVRRPSQISSVFFKVIAFDISTTWTNFSKVKSLRKLPVHKKGDKRLVKFFRPVSLLNVDCKGFEKCLYDPLCFHFYFFLSRNQHDLSVEVQSNMLKYLKNIHEALDKNSSVTVIAFYTNFAKAFDRVPPYGLLKKWVQLALEAAFSIFFVTTWKDEPSNLELETLYLISENSPMECPKDLSCVPCYSVFS